MSDEKKRGDYPDRDPVIYQIRKSQAASLKVFLGDGTEKAVAITKAGNRWHKLQEVLDSMPWERIEMVDAKGNVLGVCEREEEYDDPDDADEGGDGKQAKLAKVMFSLMKMTMVECRKMFEAQTKGTEAVIAALVDGLNEQREMHRLQLTAAVHAASGGGTDEEAGLVKMAFPMLMSMMGRPPASAPPVQARRVVPTTTANNKPGGQT